MLVWLDSMGTKGQSQLFHICTFPHMMHLMAHSYARVSSHHQTISSPIGLIRTLQFSTSFSNDGKTVISIFEFQPTSTPTVHMLSSFPIPPQSGNFYFSSVSFHASFVTSAGVTIFDIQNSKLLLQVKVPNNQLTLIGGFSPDGRFFACGISYYEICIWQNIPTGYMPWTSLRTRLSFYWFQWSPNSISILCKGAEGIQLLCPDNHPTSLSPNKTEHNKKDQKHLVTYSADKAYIATAQQTHGVITIIDCVLGSPLQSINTKMRIQDIKIVGNTIFVVDRCKLVSWDLKAGGVVHGAHGAGRVIANITPAIDACMEYLALSHDCSQIAFGKSRTLYLYDLETQKTFSRAMGDLIHSVQFSSDGHQLWCGTYETYYMGLDIAEDWSSAKITKGDSKAGQLLFGCASPHGYHVGQWVEDSRGKKLLWLPPNWRRSSWRDELKWDANFLALIHGHYTEPIIIEFPLPAAI